MNTNFQVRKVTGYDPGYPVGRRRPGRLEARPLKFLFLVVGFLFFFVGFGCTNKVETTGVQVADDDTVNTENSVPDMDDLQGVTDPDFPLDDAAVPDYDDELGGEPIPDVPPVDTDDMLTGDPVPDAPPDLSDVEGPDDDSISCPVDEELTGVVAPDSELPDYDEQLAGELAPDGDYLK